MFVLERKGAQPPVVCLHGFCQSSAYWAPTLDRVAEAGRSAIAPDLPGFAGSAGEPGPYTMEGFADRVARLLDERGIEATALLGGSMGGVVAQHFALRHPNRLTRLVLVATGAYTGDPPAALAKADSFASSAWDDDAVAPIVAGFFREAQPGERRAELIGIARQASQAAAVEAARSNARSRTLERLGEISVPTLIIQGRYDRARTPEQGAEMRERIAGAQLVILEESGHTPQLEQPDDFHEVALPFLLGASPSSSPASSERILA